MQELVCLGWREYLSLPDLGILRIRAKVDTGARTSSLHVDSYDCFERDGVAWVRFAITPSKKKPAVTVECPVADERSVTDSGGHTGRRVFIRSTLRLAGVDMDIELNLTSRQGMRFPMLLGRTAMQGRFTVDPSKSYLHRRGRTALHAQGSP